MPAVVTLCPHDRIGRVVNWPAAAEKKQRSLVPCGFSFLEFPVPIHIRHRDPHAEEVRVAVVREGFPFVTVPFARRSGMGFSGDVERMTTKCPFASPSASKRAT